MKTMSGWIIVMPFINSFRLIFSVSEKVTSLGCFHGLEVFFQVYGELFFLLCEFFTCRILDNCCSMVSVCSLSCSISMWR
ncbi:hypothetical protein GDO81_021915 [Engystomops pustulosus]|uniref:Uncharacterized protein n=1 Tax=Engystomops pustulosus TaxID=76066 RepID=A0AAV6ZU78_ENGPU|nr:hypothetical protein GDO81_021915 [Engystomops pustulosus]